MDIALDAHFENTTFQHRTRTKLDLHAEKIHVWDEMNCSASLFSFFLNINLQTEREDGYA